MCSSYIDRLSYVVKGLFPGLLWLLASMYAQAQDSTYQEMNRPQLHFTPRTHWMNDPNGLVYVNGWYHLFYQYYPKAIDWGPMHWGHAISKDLLHWQQQPIALYPDRLGYIFSGSAVYDKNNTSGLGSRSRPPLVAIFTHHDPEKQAAGKTDVESQSIAYSLDEGKTWKKYAGNPVIDNPGVRDFRDPKVFWYAPQHKWVMVVAASDRVRLYVSKNLTAWTEISQFGPGRGSHASVWECPDLFPLKVGKLTKWVLTVSEGSGGPNKGSGIQYFVGDFDGTAFVSQQTDTRWLEYGPDDYAGNSWNNTAGRRLYIGWMTNLMYAGQVPATTWRGQLTIPRKFELLKLKGRYYLCQQPIAALEKQIRRKIGVGKISGMQPDSVSLQYEDSGYPLRINVDQKRQASSFKLTFSSVAGDSLMLGFDLAKNRYFINRNGAGEMDFAHGMDRLIWSPKITAAPCSLNILVDRNCIEVFADKGLSVMTALFFPKMPLNRVRLSKPEDPERKTAISMEAYLLKSIWTDLK